MQFTSEHIREFQDAYLTDFGEEVSAEEARAMLHRLVALYELLARPLPDSELRQERGLVD